MAEHSLHARRRNLDARLKNRRTINTYLKNFSKLATELVGIVAGNGIRKIGRHHNRRSMSFFKDDFFHPFSFAFILFVGGVKLIVCRM